MELTRFIMSGLLVIGCIFEVGIIVLPALYILFERPRIVIDGIWLNMFAWNQYWLISLTVLGILRILAGGTNIYRFYMGITLSLLGFGIAIFNLAIRGAVSKILKC